MGLIVVFREAPVVLLSLLAGVFLDRHSVRILLIITSCLLACLLGLAAFILAHDGANITWLYMLALAFGAGSVFADIGLTTMIPQLVERPQLVRANSRLMIVQSAARSLMPIVGGAIVRVVQPVVGLFASALLYLLAVPALLRVPETRSGEASVEPLTLRRLIHDVHEGFRVLFDIKVLRAVIVSSCAGSFGYGIWMAMLVLTLARTFELEPFAIGAVMSFGSAATVAGSMACAMVTRRLGPGRALTVGNIMTGLGIGAMALGTATDTLTIAIIGVISMGAVTPLYAVNQISIRQAVTPPQIMGRANASRRFIVFSFLPAGAFVGGFVAEAQGLAAAFWVSAAAMVLAGLIALFSPLRYRDFDLAVQVV